MLFLVLSQTSDMKLFEPWVNLLNSVLACIGERRQARDNASFSNKNFYFGMLISLYPWKVWTQESFHIKQVEPDRPGERSPKQDCYWQ